MEGKQKADPAYWVVFIVVAIFAFVYSFNLFSGEGGGGLFESRESKRVRITTECKQEGFRKARENLQTKLRILKDKANPTPQELNDIEEYESVLNNNAVLREDSTYYYNECMERYGY